MATLFTERKLNYKEQVYIPIKFRNKIIGKGFLDFSIEEKILVELKKDFHISKANIDQVLNYLVTSNLKRVILINFGKEGATFKRIINEK